MAGRVQNGLNSGAVIGAVAGPLILCVLTLFPLVPPLLDLGLLLVFSPPGYLVLFCLSGVVFAGIGAGIGAVAALAGTAAAYLSGTILETDRLILRRLTLGDLDDLALLYRDPEVRKYFPEGTLTREETEEELRWFIDEYYGRYGFGPWAVVHKETGGLIGRCGLIPWTIDGHEEVEVAYLLAREYWGQGLATEAARAIVQYAFEKLSLTRLICIVDPENQASRSVAQKIGMAVEREWELDGAPMVIYSISI